MAINAFPIATVPPSANLIINTPAGAVTATDVQAAINQLASLIPSPGPGTDPLFLVNGFSLVTLNPTVSGDANDRWGARITLHTDVSQSNVGFCNTEALNVAIYGHHGQQTYYPTTSKHTFMALSLYAQINGSGQKNIKYEQMYGFGMGDTSIGQKLCQYSGGPTIGDEGMGFALASNLTQQSYLNLATITQVPTQSAVNTVTTQVINFSKDAQTVTLANTAGAVVGHWVIFQQELANAAPQLEAVQIQACTVGAPGTITGIFRVNHPLGSTVTPALRLFLDSTYLMGQDRVLVNMSKPTYAVGTVSSISGAGFTGSGTAWSNTMVGGNVGNIGVISLAADDYIGGPFDAGANRLRSWWQITGVSSPTQLSIWSFSTAGDQAYHGKGPGAGTYTIRQSAKVLRIISVGGSATGEIICETSTSTWSVGDSVEQIICPYPDILSFIYGVANYTNGSANRSFMTIRNSGARKIDTVFQIAHWSTINASTADQISWGSLFDNGTQCDVGFRFRDCRTAAVVLNSLFDGYTDAAGIICWGSTSGAYIKPSTANLGLEICGLIPGTGAPGHGILNFIAGSTGTNTFSNTTRMSWGGHFYMPVINLGGPQPGFILMDNVTDATNYERSFLRWASNVMEVGTEKGGSGTARDMILKTDNVERVRLQGSPTLVRVSNSGFCRSVPVTKTADFTLADTDNYIVNNKAGSTCVVTMAVAPAAQHSGREIVFINNQAQILNSHVANVIPITGGAAVQQVLPATSGAWTKLVFDGVNQVWIMVAKG